MDGRLNYPGTAIAANFGKYLNSAGKAVTDSSLPTATQALVKIRASQINGCAPCTDAHTKDAAHPGKARPRSTWSRYGGRRQSSPKPSGRPWSSPSRAPASPMPPPAASPTRLGRTPPSTTTTSSPRYGN